MSLAEGLSPPAALDEAAPGKEGALRLGEAMKRLHRHISSKVMRGMQSELTALDLTFAQITALHQLRARGRLSITDLAARTHLSVPAASHLVERLVQRGLAARQENPENRREKQVQLTDAGLSTVSTMDHGFVDAYVTTFAELPSHLVQAATENLEHLIAALDERTAEGTTDPCTPAQETP